MILRSYQLQLVDRVLTHNYRPGVGVLAILGVGGGKTAGIAQIIKEVRRQAPGERILVLSHRAELLSQSAQRLQAMAPDINFGVFSAGLGRKQIRDVTIAGIQSIHRVRLPPIGLVIVDECHLISQNSDSMYRKLLDRQLDIEPEMRVVGLTATDYRLGQGRLTDGDNAIFGEVCFEMSMKQLIDEGWLVPFVSKVGKSEADLSGVHTRGGEFVAGEAEAVMDTEELVESAVADIIEQGVNRRSWLVFAAGVQHAEHVCEAFRRHGISAACVFGHTQNRKAIFDGFRSGHYRALVNVEVATTGLDIPQIDLIALLRPTKSPGLLVQISGRGSRPLPGVFDGVDDDAEARKAALAASAKPSCLFLDFTSSIRDLGPLDAVKPPRPKGAKKDGDKEAPTKVCPTCRNVVAPSTRSCPDCGHEWPPPELKHQPKASTAPVMSTEPKELATLPVLGVNYFRHTKAGRPDSFRVEYRYGAFDTISSWVCFEHSGPARSMAEVWWRKNAHRGSKIPRDVADALARTDELKEPMSVVVREEGKYLAVVKVIYDEAARQTKDEENVACQVEEHVC